MGMFDYVKCDRVMPDGFDGAGAGFQTKDFDCGMDTLEITEDGRLVLRAWASDGIVPKEERPYPDAPEDSLLSLVGSMKSKELPPQELDYHGHMYFYAHDKSGCWHEYKAKFTDGRLVEIKTLTTPAHQTQEGE